MTTTTQESQARGWKDLTTDERKALSPIERARARTIDSQARAARDEARLARLEKRASDERRKRDTKRLILMGAALESWAKDPEGFAVVPLDLAHADPAQFAHALLDRYTPRPADRAFLGLPSRPATTSNIGGSHPSAGLYEMADLVG